MKKVVAIGGGTGMPILIKSIIDRVAVLDAIVTVADDGGSSGHLRNELAGFPPGDSRNCLVAMANGSIMSRLFQYRFPRGDGLKSHSLGNLIISALSDLTGDFQGALSVAGEILGSKGRVLPPSLEPLTLFAEVESWPNQFGRGRAGPGNSARVVGQCNVANRLRRLLSIGIEPGDAKACPEAVSAIDSADLIILGPGSLYTSVIPNLLVKGIADAFRKSQARKIFLCNNATQPGETDGLTAADHLDALNKVIGPRCCDLVITGESLLSSQRLLELEEARSAPILVDADRIIELGANHVSADIASEDCPAHHDPDKLGSLWDRLLPLN